MDYCDHLTPAVAISSRFLFRKDLSDHRPDIVAEDSMQNLPHKSTQLSSWSPVDGYPFSRKRIKFHSLITTNSLKSSIVPISDCSAVHSSIILFFSSVSSEAFPWVTTLAWSCKIAFQECAKSASTASATVQDSFSLFEHRNSIFCLKGSPFHSRGFGRSSFDTIRGLQPFRFPNLRTRKVLPPLILSHVAYLLRGFPRGYTTVTLSL